jgi:hypothetical protein
MMKQPRVLAIAFAGLIGAAIALLIDAHALLLTYLATAVGVSAIAIGSLGVLMLTYLVRGRWTEALHLPLTAAALCTPVAGLLFIPLLTGIGWIYPWVHESHGASGSFKAIWLSPAFFIGRTVFYFTVLTVLASWLRRAWTDPQRMVVSASAGLIVYALTVSLAGVDWLQSLTPEFHSSIYGLLFLTFQLLAGFAFALVIALWQPHAPTHRYGAILLSGLLMWAYNHAMQYIIVWSGNLPDEVVWYVRRESGGWGVLLWALLALQFIVPFFAMLSERVRNGRRFLLAIAGMTLACRFAEAYLLALPGHGMGAVLWLTVPATLALCGGAWWLAFLTAFEKVQTSAQDTRQLSEAFDASGSPASADTGHSR